MKDYATTKKGQSSTRYPMVYYLCYDSSHYKSYFSRFSDHIEPKFFRQEAKDERWVQAMKQEIQALEDNNTWDLVNLPQGMNTIGSKWVYKIKYKVNGEVERYKVRLVAKGYSQQEGLDYHDTFFSLLLRWRQ